MPLNYAVIIQTDIFALQNRIEYDMIKNFLFFFLISASFTVFSQTDSLILSNGDLMVGEVKNMDRGVLVVETDYSDADFKIEWEKVKKIKASRRYLITLSNGTRINGTFESAGAYQILIINEQGEDLTVSQDDIVHINSLEDSFLSRLSANIDFGYSLTRANNQQQMNTNFRMAYEADRWMLDIYYNNLITTRDDVDRIERDDAGLGYRYYLPRDWYLGANANLLSNTEQSIELRATGKFGIGKYMIHTNQTYWGFSGGVAYNNENFSSIFLPDRNEFISVPSRESLEAFIGSELNLFDIGDLNLFLNITAYPNIIIPENVDPGRFRTDFRFDAIYDNLFIDDFYVRASYTLNYDNRPAEAGKETDYIFTTGFGWSW